MIAEGRRSCVSCRASLIGSTHVPTSVVAELTVSGELLDVEPLRDVGAEGRCDEACEREVLVVAAILGAGFGCQCALSVSKVA